MARNKRPIEVVVGFGPVTAWEKARAKRHEARQAVTPTPKPKAKPALAPTVENLAAHFNTR